MDQFMIHFLLCNLMISAVTGVFLTGKRLMRSRLSSRVQYNLWFLLLSLLAVPFLPIQNVRSLRAFFWLETLRKSAEAAPNTASSAPAALLPAAASNWMNDIGSVVSSKAPSGTGILLFAVWLAGIAAMLVWMARSAIRFHRIRQSAMPLQSTAVRQLYQDCLTETGITKKIPVYSTAFLKSPVLAGLFHPCIYLPIHLIADSNAKDIRYMLLHELQHYRHKDALTNCAAIAANVLYWFNPVVWYALREMKTDREVACDTSVLNMLAADACEDYGHTLINFAEKVSRLPSPFATGIGGSMEQMRKRITNIAAYQPPSRRKNLRGIVAYALTALLLSGFAPLLAINASDSSHYTFPESTKNISSLNLDAVFGENDGSFVLYDADADSWQIYHKEAASTRVSPVSTFKIYSALLGLESGLIAPRQSQIAWNGQRYPYDTWNADQTLQTAMQNSVTWYFQTLDHSAGLPAIRNFVREIGYGNQTVGENLSAYWGDSSLTISPIEQVALLEKFYENQFGFAPENIAAVKDAIRLYDTENGTLFGKTGTGDENGKNVLGWFVGYLEKDGRVYYFATNIQNTAQADGAGATRLTLAALARLGLF